MACRAGKSPFEFHSLGEKTENPFPSSCRAAFPEPKTNFLLMRLHMEKEKTEPQSTIRPERETRGTLLWFEMEKGRERKSWHSPISPVSKGGGG